MKALRYAQRLIEFNTTSHRTNRSINKYLELKLTKHGFVVEKIDYEDRKGVAKSNLVAKKGGGQGGLALFGHTDVVPAKKWFTREFGPFEPHVAQERLYGRGACDMKGSVACMLTAAQSVAWDDLEQPVYLVFTADEEVGFHGVKQVVDRSRLYREMVQHQTKAIIGEPTMLDVVHAHKGSAEIRAVSRGKAAHSSSREGVNSNLPMIPFLGELKAILEETETETQWQNSNFDPPTLSGNIRIKDDSPALNVVPGKTTVGVYLRTMPNVDEMPVVQRIRQAGEKWDVEVKLKRWGGTFFTDPETAFVQQSLKLAVRQKSHTVSYGTDGGKLDELENKIIFGPGNIAQAHTENEWISLEQLKLGTEMYSKMIRHWCCR